MRRCLLLVWLLSIVSVGRASAPLILISLDAFRYDYCELHPEETPNLRELARNGVTATGLIPVFPSNTFPNHYAIVTGLYPAHHGITNNDFFDSESGTYFHSSIGPLVQNSRWWKGEPIWVTAIKQKRKSAASFWAGSEAEVQGLHPTYWKPFDYRIPFEARLQELIGWMKLSEAERPAFVAFYLEETNTAGHLYGPESPEVLAAIKLLDGQVGTIVRRLQEEGIEANIVVVSDHGMTPVAAERVVFLEIWIDLKTVQIDFQGSVTGLRPLDGDVTNLMDRLKGIPHADVYSIEQLPERLHLTAGPRVPPVWIVSNEGWHVATQAGFEKTSRRAPDRSYLRGDHGYDPAIRTMWGIFIAQGPSFRKGETIPAVENVHIYNLLCATLGLKPATNDGDNRLINAVMR